MDSGALDALVICLEEFDPGVKESAAWALGYIARHNAGQELCNAKLEFFLLSFTQQCQLRSVTYRNADFCA